MKTKESKMKLKVDDEFKALLAPLDEKTQRMLEESIVAEGCREPLVVWKGEGILLDGHNRMTICESRKLPYQVQEIEMPDRDAAKTWIIRNQIGKRNLKPEQIAAFRGMLYEKTKKDDGVRGKKKLAHNEPASTAESLGKEFGVSAATIKRDYEFVQAQEKLKDIDPDIQQKVLSGNGPTKKAVVTAAKVMDDDPEMAAAILSGNTKDAPQDERKKYNNGLCPYYETERKVISLMKGMRRKDDTKRWRGMLKSIAYWIRKELKGESPN